MDAVCEGAFASDGPMMEAVRTVAGVERDGLAQRSASAITHEISRASRIHGVVERSTESATAPRRLDWRALDLLEPDRPSESSYRVASLEMGIKNDFGHGRQASGH